MNRKFTFALGLLVAAAGMPATYAAEELNGDLSGGKRTTATQKQSSSASVSETESSSGQASSYDRSESSSRSDRSSVTVGSGQNQGDRTTAREAEADRQIKLAATDMAAADANLRMHLAQARSSFKADDPSEASRHINQAIAVINQELGAGSQKADARMSVNERTASSQASASTSLQPGDQSRTQYSSEATEKRSLVVQADSPAERDLRRSLQSLEEFNKKLSQNQFKSQDDFKQVYANVYRDLALYHYAKAQQDPNAMSTSAAHRDTTAAGGASDIPSSDGSRPITSSQIDDATRMHGNNATSAATGRQARHTPNYHAQQAAEYLQTWAQLEGKDLDSKSMTTIQSFRSINISSKDRVEQARLAELGRMLDENGIRTETIATERSSSTSSTSVDSDNSGTNRSQSSQSSSERSTQTRIESESSPGGAAASPSGSQQ